MEEPSPALAKCLQLLQGPTDSERFVGLLLITKVVPSEALAPGSADPTLRQIFDAIGFDFIDRLLRTKGGAPEADTADASYRGMGISILAAFCGDLELVQHSNMTSKIPMLLSILSEDKLGGMTTYELEDILSIIAAVVAGSDSGVQVLYEADGLRLLASILATLPPSTDSIVTSAMETRVISILEHALHRLPPPDPAILSSLPALAAIFAHRDDTIKFELTSLLAVLLTAIQTSPSSTTSPRPAWAPLINSGVASILGSRTGEKQRNNALLLAGLMVDIFGFEWCFDSALPSQQAKVDDALHLPSSSRLAFLIVHIIRVEVQVLFHEASVSLSEYKQSVLVGCFHLAAGLIDYLSAAEDAAGLSYEGLIKVQGALVDIFTTLMEFISLQKNEDDASPPKSLVLLEAAKLWGKWLAEETAALRREVCQTLDALLHIAAHRPDMCTPLVRAILPAIDPLTAEDDTRTTFLDAGGLPLILGVYTKGVPDEEPAVSDQCMTCLLNLLIMDTPSEGTILCGIEVLPLLVQQAGCSGPYSSLRAATTALALLNHASKHKRTISNDMLCSLGNAVLGLCCEASCDLDDDLWTLCISQLVGCAGQYEALHDTLQRSTKTKNTGIILASLTLRTDTARQNHRALYSLLNG
eukprot:TRINITY_DN5086_c0_g1_i1.p1 TRINITY_DN5086_c0_g1~~TRINITY_DN5086_c0_g1_i1.p1  ORF type:complete len:659 (+),score=139.47 TRINITY_DN5086_c0_g1_i1:54-1979(+)